MQRWTEYYWLLAWLKIKTAFTHFCRSLNTTGTNVNSTYIYFMFSRPTRQLGRFMYATSFATQVVIIQKCLRGQTITYYKPCTYWGSCGSSCSIICAFDLKLRCIGIMWPTVQTDTDSGKLKPPVHQEHWKQRKNGLTSSLTGLILLPTPAFISPSPHPSPHSLSQPSLQGFLFSHCIPALLLYPSCLASVHLSALSFTAYSRPSLPVLPTPRPPSPLQWLLPLWALLSLGLGLLCENGVIVALLQCVHECVCAFLCVIVGGWELSALVPR